MYSYIYMQSDSENELRCSGIAFHEFQKYVEPSIENLILLKGDFLGKKNINNFNLYEGQEQICSLAEETKANGHCLGDFHFIDYSGAKSVSKLTDTEMMEMLYLSHMWKPVHSPFFETLQNRFVYLAHDDDWSCKIYIAKKEKIINVAAKKIEKYAECQIRECVGRKERKNFRNSQRVAFIKKSGKSVISIDEQIRQKVFEGWSNGVFIDLSGMQIVNSELIIKLYFIGRFSDMDDMFNSIEKHKSNAAQIRCLCYNGSKWNVTEIK